MTVTDLGDDLSSPVLNARILIACQQGGVKVYASRFNTGVGVAVVRDDPDAGFKYWVAAVTRFEIRFLPES